MPSLKGKRRFHLLLICPALLTLLIAPVFVRISQPPSLAQLAQRGACLKSPPVYVFVHLHKTAGNNLKIALIGFAKRNGLKLYHTCHRAVPDSRFARWWFNRRKDPDGIDCNLAQFADLPRQQRLNYDLIVGHQSIGVHSLIHPRDARYFTFLRHPLRRKISHYAHFEASSALRNITKMLTSSTIRSSAVSKLQPELLHALHDEQSHLTRYLTQENRNYMVKRLSAGSYTSEIGADIRARFVDVDVFAARAALRAAQRNLVKRFFFVGLQERYEESMCILASILNSACYRNGRHASRRPFDPQKVVQSHVNERETSQVLLDSLPQFLSKATLRAEDLDVRLYKFAQALFEDELRRYPHCKRMDSGSTQDPLRESLTQ